VVSSSFAYQPTLVLPLGPAIAVVVKELIVKLGHLLQFCHMHGWAMWFSACIVFHQGMPGHSK
jgi:hypothetical protein